ncbi:HigA family addiction module antitoxin [Larkinella ripae]
MKLRTISGSAANNQTPGGYVREKVLLPKKMSVTEAAKILGIGRPAFSNFLNGNASLSPEMASRIERAFGIPTQKLHELQALFDALQAKAKGSPSNTKAYVPPFLNIIANEIETWASSIGARSRLSVFLRILVNSTGVSLTKVDFPGNNDAERPGWDGWIEANEGTPWIPEGQSGWEFGCNQNPKEKADKDYAKSVNAVNKSSRASITFIFITPRHWLGKTKWANERKSEGNWKDVRAYDASDLEQWLEQSVAGQTWFSSETQRASDGTRSLDKCWLDWSGVANPPLTGDLFTTTVLSSKDMISAYLSKPAEQPIIIAADSTEEAVAFLAVLFSGSDEELASFRDRVIVFDRPNVLPKIAAGSSNFIAVTTSRDVERELGPYSRSIHTIIVYPRNAISAEPHILLEPLNYEAFSSALENAGYKRDEIDRLDRKSGRSLTVLRRQLSDIPAIKKPEWAVSNEKAADLTPFLLAGAWSSTNPWDQIILSSFADNTPFENLEKKLQEFTQLNDAPVWSIGEYRGVISKIDLLFALSGTITRKELETYFEVAKYVIAEEDPILELPEDKRWLAGFYGKTRQITGALRKGICETLVLLAVHGNELFYKKLGVNVEAMAVRLIRELLGDPLTTRTLEMHDRDLPTYAEVAPDEFLRILEKDLKTAAPASLNLMRPAGIGIFGGSSRTGLLWALENLAWSPKTLLRAVLILAKLAEIKIEDNLINKPISSLNAIFRCWMPQTAASIRDRINALKSLAKHYPKIAWAICMEQFGQIHRMGTYNHKPHWRNDAQGHGDPVTVGEMEEFVIEVVKMALSWEEYDKSAIGDLIERLHSLDDNLQKDVWNIVTKWADTANDLDKAWVREKVRVSTISKRGVIQNRNVKGRKPDAAKAAFAALEPSDIVNKHEWLFRKQWIEESFDEMHNDDLDIYKREERITKMRVDALQEIISEQGITGVLRLAEMGETSLQIGALLVSKILPDDEVTPFILTLFKSGEKSDSWIYRNLIKGSIWAIQDDSKRNELLKTIGGLLPSEKLTRLLELAPFRTATWSLIKEMGETHEKEYWATVQPNWEGQNKDELNEIVNQLLSAKRPHAAFSCVRLSIEKLRPALLFKLMEGLVTVKDELDDYFKFESWDVKKAFELLDASDSFSIEQMAGLELSYIDVLARYWGDRTNHGIPNLETYIDKNPEFFAQVVAWLYKRADGGTDPEELQLEKSEYIENRAGIAYKLIEGLQRIPGRNKQGDIDEDQLLGWVNIVRKSCAELGRQETGDRSLGKLFAESPKGADGVWPCEPVRQVLEQIQSEDISRGITLGLYNSRGTHWRGEGGDQERSISSMYRKWAKALEFSHPFVASTILNSMANEYEREAQREDLEARVNRRLR